MPDSLHRIRISISPELQQQLDQLKQEPFCDKAQPELLRYLIELGLKSVENSREKSFEALSQL